MKFNLNIFNVFLIFFLYWISFEWVFLSALNDYSKIVLIRSVIDTLPIFMLVVYFSVYPLSVRLVSFNILLIVLGIVLTSVASLLIESTSPSVLIYNLGVTFRFLPFIIITRAIDNSSYYSIIKHVKIIFWAQIILSIFQLINRDLFFQLFLPNLDVFGTFIPTSYRENAINSTFINTIDYSFFLLALTIIYVYHIESIKYKWFIIGVSMVFITLSHSTASIIACVIFAFLESKQKTFLFLFSIIPIMLILFYNQSILLEFIGKATFHEWYENTSQYSRVGYFTTLLPEFFNSNFKDVVLGMGLDVDLINIKLKDYSNLPITLTYGHNNLVLLKDVYWLSVLFTQGIVGFILYLFLFLYIQWYGKNSVDIKQYSMLKSFMITTFFLGFFNQVLDIKGFSCCLWLIIGLIFNKKYLNETIKSNNNCS